ncbi:MAG: beta-ketoacyl synthase N-terminal-like domain-containing protein, partial [Myxococcota bacterium]
MLHPLVQHNASGSEGIKFQSVFTGGERVLAHHRVGDTRVLPGAAYLEMARAAVAMASQREVYKLQNIVWARPIAVRDAPAHVAVDLKPDGDGFQVEVVTEHNGEHAGERTAHAQLRVLCGQTPDRLAITADSHTIDVAAVQARCPRVIANRELYPIFARHGLSYGPAFRAIEHLYCSPSEALAVLRLPVVCEDDTQRYGLDPSLLDAALQASIGLQLGRQSDHDAHDEATQLPFALGSAVIHQPAAAAGYAYVRYSPGTNPASKALKYDIIILNDRGEVCIELSEFATRLTRPSAGPAIATQSTGQAQVTAPVQQTGSERHNVDLGTATAEFLVRSVCEILRLSPEDIAIDEEMSAYGADSITLTELSNRVSREFDIEIAPTIFFECPTLASFCDYLADNHRDALITALAAEPGGAPHRRPEEPAPSGGIAARAAGPAPSVPSATATVDPVSDESSRTYSDDDIAIVGMSGRYPMAEDLTAFWANLRDGRDCISEVPDNRWDWRAIDGDPIGEGNKSKVKWGGFIDDIDRFDPLFFGISPREAALMDPQQRLLMMYVWRAIEDAGHAPSSLAGSATGIFVGTAGTGYSERALKWRDVEGATSTAVVPSAGPNRISYVLDIHGPSEPVETACSSSLVALHRAVQAIRNGECDQALAGGVNTLLSAEVHISFTKAGMLCPDGRCKTFSKDANGYVRGEGVGIVFLKRLRDARRD